MICRKCGKQLPAGAAMCPVCGTHVVPEVAARPTVTIVPPTAEVVTPNRPARQTPPPAPNSPAQRKITSARVLVILLSLVSMAATCGVVFLWFWPDIELTDIYGNVTRYAMHALYRNVAPYMSYVLPAIGVVSALFTASPLLRRFSEKRKRLVVPKLCAVLMAACCVVPARFETVSNAVYNLSAGGHVPLVNVFTGACLALLMLLFVVSDLTVRNMRLVLERRVDNLRAQLLDSDIQPRF